MRIKLIVNPSAGKGKALGQLRHVLASLERHNIEADISHTCAKGHARTLALEASDKFPVIAGLGGDGTLNEIASGLKHTGIPMACYPAGTGNDFIKALGERITHEDVTAGIKRGSTRTLDMGEVNGNDFINVLGMGFDALVAARNAQIKWTSGIAAYMLALARALPSYSRYAVNVTTGAGTIEKNIVFLTIGNGPVCGGGFRLTPGALVDDGMLDVTMVEYMPLPCLLMHLPKAFNGRVAEISQTTMLRSGKLTITSPAPMPAHLDGEVLSPYQSRYEIGINPGALMVILP